MLKFETMSLTDTGSQKQVFFTNITPSLMNVNTVKESKAVMQSQGMILSRSNWWPVCFVVRCTSSWSELWNSFVIINEVPLKHRRQAYSQLTQCILSEVFLKVYDFCYCLWSEQNMAPPTCQRLQHIERCISCLMTKCIDVLNTSSL